MKKQKMIVGVVGLPLKKDGRMLLTRRYSPGNKAWHKKWQLAGGGMEFGEMPEQTLAREFQEELRASARILYPLPIVKTKTWYGNHLDSAADTHIILICYLVDIGDQKIDVTFDEETSEYNWFTFEETLKLDFLPLTDEIINGAMEVVGENGILEKLG